MFAGCTDTVDRNSVSLFDALPPPSIEERTLGGDTRASVMLPASSSLSFPLVVPKNPILEFFIASPSRGRVALSVRVRKDDVDTSVFREVLTRSPLPRWTARRADLTPWEKKAVELVFETADVSDSADVAAFLGSPRVSSRAGRENVSRQARLFNEWHRPPSYERGAEERVADTKFSRDRGFYEEPFTVYLSTKTSGATIVYTTDGSRPSPRHGTIGNSVYIADTTILRVMAYKRGKEPTNVDTQTYIFTRRVQDQGGTKRDSAARYGLDIEIDPDVVSGNESDFVEALRSLAAVSIAASDDVLFGDEGVYTALDRMGQERRASIELIYPESRRFARFQGFQAESGVRLHGHPGNLEKRSLRVVFRKKFGQGKLAYPVFESAVHHGESAANEFDSLILRAGGQANWGHRLPQTSEAAVFIRDQHARDTELYLSGMGARGIFVHLYLNGIYWGVYNLVERPDRHFLANYFGGSSDDWIAVNHGGPVGTPPPSHRRRWEELERFAREPEPASSYEVAKSLVDTERFSDYVLSNWFSGMGDWGKNNWYGAMRVEPEGPAMFFSWDAELTYGLTARFLGANRAAGSPGAWVHPAFVGKSEAIVPRLWHKLQSFPEFRMKFSDRVYRAIARGGPLEDRVNRENFTRLSDYIGPAIVAESARWGDAASGRESKPRTLEGDWIPARDQVLELMAGNAERFLKALRRHGYYPSIDPPRFDSVEGGRVLIRRPEGADLVCYTTDGSDPTTREDFCFSDAEKSVPANADLKARARRHGEWSALNELALWDRGW